MESRTLSNYLPTSSQSAMLSAWLIALAMVLLSMPATALQRYEAAIDEAKWSVVASPIQCELKQEIPAFGRAVFMHSSGGELSFVIRVEQPPTKDSMALLFSSPPYWKPHLVARELSRSSLIKGKTPIYFSRDVALRMLYELDQGMQPSLHFRDWADQSEDVTVAVSTVSFRDSWPEFSQCQSKLLGFGFDDVKNTSMLFDSGSSRLKPDSKEILDRVALYVKNDPSIKKLQITGHTDSVGFKYLNQLLSKRRARAVSKYLISKGVPKKKLKLSGRGEKKPHVSNASLTGRKFNRRVQVELLK